MAKYLVFTGGGVARNEAAANLETVIDEYIKADDILHFEFVGGVECTLSQLYGSAYWNYSQALWAIPRRPKGQ